MEWLILTSRDWVLVTLVCITPYFWWPHEDAHSSQNSPLPDELMHPTQWLFFLGLVSTTFCIIFAFTDITISCQIKTAFHLIFSSRNCLINEQGLICTDDHRATQLHQIAHPEMVHHIVLITEWQLLPGVVYINAARLWKGIIVVLNAVEADRIHFLTCQGQQQKSGSCRGLSTQRKMNLFAQTCMHTRGHMNTHIARQNQPHST